MIMSLLNKKKTKKKKLKEAEQVKRWDPEKLMELKRKIDEADEMIRRVEGDLELIEKESKENLDTDLLEKRIERASKAINSLDKELNGTSEWVKKRKKELEEKKAEIS